MYQPLKGLTRVFTQCLGHRGLEYRSLADSHAGGVPAEAGEGVEEAAEVGGGGFDGVEQGLGLVDFGYVGI